MSEREYKKHELPTLEEAYQTGWDAGIGYAAALALTAYPAPERARVALEDHNE